MGGFFNNIYQMFNPKDDEQWDPMGDSFGGGGMAEVQFGGESGNTDSEDPAFRPRSTSASPIGAPGASSAIPLGGGPRVIPPRLPRPGMEAYLEHMRNAPVDKPSTLNTILSGIGAFATAWGRRDPAAGIETFQKLHEMPYQQELAKWRAKGGELGKAAELEEKMSQFDTTAGLKGQELGIKAGELDAKKDQILKNYEVASKNAKTNADRVAAQRDRDAALKALGEERNRIDAREATVREGELGVHRQEANTNAFEAETGRQRAGAYAESLRQGGRGGMGGATKPDDMMKAEQDVLLELMAKDPQYREFFSVDDQGNVMPKMGDFDENQLKARELLMMNVGLEVQKRLGGESFGAPPTGNLWRMRPPVQTPPNMRRIP